MSVIRTRIRRLSRSKVKLITSDVENTLWHVCAVLAEIDPMGASSLLLLSDKQLGRMFKQALRRQLKRRKRTRRKQTKRRNNDSHVIAKPADIPLQLTRRLRVATRLQARSRVEIGVIHETVYGIRKGINMENAASEERGTVAEILSASGLGREIHYGVTQLPTDTVFLLDVTLNVVDGDNPFVRVVVPSARSVLQFLAASNISEIKITALQGRSPEHPEAQVQAVVGLDALPPTLVAYTLENGERFAIVGHEQPERMWSLMKVGTMRVDKDDASVADQDGGPE